MYLFNFIHSKSIFKTLPQSFYIAQSQKLWRPALCPVRAGSNPRRRPRFLPPPPPVMLTLYYLAKSYPVA